MDVTEIVRHMQPNRHRLDRWGVRIAQVDRTGEYVVQQLSSNPGNPRAGLVSLNVSFHKTEAEARAAANVEWIGQRKALAA